MPPRGQARSDFDILRGIAERLGVADAFTEGRDEMPWVRLLYERSRDDALRRHGHTMPGFDEFWHTGWAAMPVRGQHVFLEDFRADPKARPLHTDSGLITLHSPRLQALGLADCPATPSWLEPAEWLGSATAQGRLHLISRQPQHKLHSQLDDAPASRAAKVAGREPVLIHPDDARRLGVADRATVRLWNERGQCLAAACLSADVRPGVVALPTGAWYSPLDDSDQALDDAGNPNVLTLDIGTSAFGQGCSAHTCLVWLEPWPTTAQPAQAAAASTVHDPSTLQRDPTA